MDTPYPLRTDSRRPIGQILLDQGLISEDQLRIALLEQERSPQTLGKLLVELGFITEATLRDALGQSLGHVAVDLARVTVDAATLGMVPQELAKRHGLLPLAYDALQQRLTIATANPNDIVALDRLKIQLGGTPHIEPLLAGEQEIYRAIDQYYGHELSIDGILHEIETGEVDYRSLAVSTEEYKQPVVRLMDALLTDAVKRNASDIHFEPEAGFLRIRYRIDGMLRQIRALHKSYWPAMAVRLKVMAGMNIAETRAPQDGHITLGINGRPVDFRVAAHPTIHGENLVLRILDRQNGIVPIDHLGLDPQQQMLLTRMIARPEGIILVTGPTGSGKTTTLYSMLHHINREGVNIMTLEDPVEYPMAMIRQTSIAESVKLDFANGIRSMMRQDPDVILVGEIRDSDTADMAFRAAMTGHQVYATLHTNSAIGAIPRLLDIGILPDIMAGNIIGIIAQRLVRKLCHHCRRIAADTTATMASPMLADIVHYAAVGCEACDFQGYRGRIALMELLPMDQELDDLIARRATAQEMRAVAEERGFRSLAEDGLRRVAEGVTTLAEVARVVDLGRRH
ncbi:GspE/PulE family protein [Denitratisoma sp. agr-D3]